MSISNRTGTDQEFLITIVILYKNEFNCHTKQPVYIRFMKCVG